MKTYTDRETTPLRFHKFNKTIRIPLSLFFQALTLCITLYQSSANALWFVFDVSFALAMVVACIVALKDCKHWKPSAWYAIISLSVVPILYDIIIPIFVGKPYSPSDFVMVLVGIAIHICIIVYYTKRKPLFMQS